MLALLRQRNYGLLWWGQLFSMIGMWALFAALPFYVYQLTGSIASTGAMFVVQTVPPLVLGVSAGVFVDRWNHQRTMIGANLIRATLLLLLFGVRSAETVWIVYVVGFLLGCVEQFFGPANNALLPRLVGEDRLLTANALDALGENMARLIGPAIGGVLLAWLGLSSVALFEAVGAVVAAGLIALIIVPAQKDAAPGDASAPRRPPVAFWEELAGGLRLVWQRAPLRSSFLVFGIALLGDSMLTVLLAPFVDDIIGAGAAAFGLILTARGIGGILGGLIVGRVGPRVHTGRMIAGGLMLTGIGTLVIVLFPTLAVLLAIVLLIGIPAIAWLSGNQTWLQAHTPALYRGRVFGAFGMTNAFMLLIGTLFASSLGEQLGIMLIMGIVAALYFAAGMVALWLLRDAMPAPIADGQPDMIA